MKVSPQPSELPLYASADTYRHSLKAKPSRSTPAGHHDSFRWQINTRAGNKNGKNHNNKIKGWHQQAIGHPPVNQSPTTHWRSPQQARGKFSIGFSETRYSFRTLPWLWVTSGCDIFLSPSSECLFSNGPLITSTKSGGRSRVRVVVAGRLLWRVGSSLSLETRLVF